MAYPYELRSFRHAILIPLMGFSRHFCNSPTELMEAVSFEIKPRLEKSLSSSAIFL